MPHNTVSAFYDAATAKDPSGIPSIGIYQELIHYRFYEVITGSFPLFTQYIDESKLDNMINQFIRFGAKSLFIWQTPKEFMRYVKKIRLLEDQPYLYDLLRFEWIEVALMMQNYSRLKRRPFSWENRYTLPKNIKLFKTNYNLITQDFSQKQKQYLLAYYDVETHDVRYQEAHEALYRFLKILNKKQTLHEHLQTFAERYGLDAEEAKSFLEPPLRVLL
jgi:hypothetical protein